MDRSTVNLAIKVARGERGQALKDFQMAMSLAGYRGVRGRGVRNADGEIVARTWATFATDLLDKRKAKEEAPLTDAEAEEMAAAEIEELEELGLTKAEARPEIVYFYETRTPFVTLSVDTRVQVSITERRNRYEEAPCKLSISPECDPTKPNMGFLRVIPQSMLPGEKDQEEVQCLACHEVGAEGYIRDLHGRIE